METIPYTKIVKIDAIPYTKTAKIDINFGWHIPSTQIIHSAPGHIIKDP